MNRQVPKIRICVPFPNHGAVSSETHKSLELLKDCPDVFVEILEIQGSSISMLRNVGVNRGVSEIVKQQGFEFDYYLSVDADIAFVPDHLLQLLKHDLDIVGAAYQYRAQEDLLVAGFFDSCEGHVSSENFLPCHASGLKEVDWIGAGFTLIKRNVFETMDFPWYREQIVEYIHRGNKHARWVGEDVGLCIGARKHGFKIYCDCDCRVKHLIDIGTQQKNSLLKKDSYSLDEAAGLVYDMLDQVKIFFSSFHNGLKEFEAKSSAGKNSTEQ